MCHIILLYVIIQRDLSSYICNEYENKFCYNCFNNIKNNNNSYPFVEENYNIEYQSQILTQILIITMSLIPIYLIHYLFFI